MATFSKTFITVEGSLTLSFRKVECFTSKKYFVVAHNGYRQVAAFEMKESSDGKWKVLQPAPSSIVQVEPKLAAAIEEYNKEVLQ